MSVQGAVLAGIAILVATGIVLAVIYTAGLGLQEPVPAANADKEATVAASTWGDRLERVATAGVLIGGLVALSLAYWRGNAADRQASAAQRQVDTALSQSDTAQAELRNRMYQSGAEMLGSDLLAVRLAGIYALDRLARDHPSEYYLQIKRLFCAFVRFPISDKRGAIVGLNVRDDVQQIMWALRDRTDEQRERDLADPQGFDFTASDLRWSQLVGINLTHASFLHANLSSSYLNRATLPHANFGHADASQVDFDDAHLEFALFYKTNLERATFRGAFLGSASFSGNKFHSARFGGSDMRNANLRNADLTGTDLSGVNLEEASLDFETSLKDVDLHRANLTGAQCKGLNLSGARMFRSDLTGAVLVGANLEGADLSYANLSGALIGVPTHDPAIGLTQKQLDQAAADPENPPRLDGALDAETGEQLRWQGKTWEGSDAYGPQPGSF